MCKRLVSIILFILSLMLLSRCSAVDTTVGQVANVSTTCNIFVDALVEGQPITIKLQIYPAPPEGEIISNLSVGIISPLQGISGWGCWDQKNVRTDSNGVAVVTFYVQTLSANWNVWVYFGGQYFANNTIFFQSGFWERYFFISPAKTPTPTPSAVSTLGPLEIRSAGDRGTNVEIFKIQNQSTLVNPVQLLFRINALLLPFSYSSVGNIGYSIDGGTIYAVHNSINETIIHNVADEATVYANVTLPSLAEGSHTATVYWGWYFEGINQRYEVFAYSTVNFSVTSSLPTTTANITPIQTPISTRGIVDNALLIAGIIGVLAIAVVGVSVICFKKSHSAA